MFQIGVVVAVGCICDKLLYVANELVIIFTRVCDFNTECCTRVERNNQPPLGSVLLTKTLRLFRQFKWKRLNVLRAILYRNRVNWNIHRLIVLVGVTRNAVIVFRIAANFLFYT